MRTLLVYPGERGKTLETKFEHAGFEVATADSATGALAMISEGDFDCIVCSQSLPGDDGLSLVDAVQTVDPGLPCVMYSDVGDSLVNEAFDTGVERFVPRNGSESVSTLIEEVENVISPGSPQQQDISGHEPEPEELVRTIDEAPIGISISDPSLPDNPLVYINDGWTDVTGYDPEDALGRNPRLLQGPETDPARVEELSEAVRHDEPVTVEIRNYRSDGTPFWNELTVAPIRNDDDEVVHYVGFQHDVTDRKSAENLAAERARRLEEEKQTLQRVLGRVNGLLHEISRALIEENERPIVTQRVCDEIVAADGYVASWLATTNPTAEKIQFSATAGFSTPPGGSLQVAELPDAVGQAIESEQMTVCTSEGETATQLAPEAVGARRLGVFPLFYGEQCYGLLGVYGDSNIVLDRREQQLFDSVSRMVASRLNAIETTQILTTDRVLELEVAIQDDTFVLTEVAQTLESAVEYIGLTIHPDQDHYELFLGASDETTITALDELDTVEHVREISATDSAYTFAIQLGSNPPFVDLADNGAVVVSGHADSNCTTLTMELPPDHDVRSVLDLLDGRYEQVDLRAQHTREREEQTLNRFAANVDQRLTARQRETLKTAFVNGYFEWPRPTDGTEIAETMGITRQTFHQHLRAAERELIDAYVECYSDDVTPKVELFSD